MTKTAPTQVLQGVKNKVCMSLIFHSASVLGWSQSPSIVLGQYNLRLTPLEV